MKAFLSSPAYNDPQLKGHSKIQDSLSEAGFEVVNPNALTTVEADGKTPRDPKDLLNDRLNLLDDSDVFVGWVDRLNPPGVKHYILRGVQTEIEIPLPEQYIQFMAIGMQASGVAQTKPKEGLIVPGRDDPRGLEITNVPRSLHIQPQNGVFGQLASPGPINLPDSLVMFEAGAAVAQGMPVVLLAAASPIIGIAAVKALLIIQSFEDLTPCLKMVYDGLSDEDEPGYWPKLEEKCQDYMKQKHEALVERVQQAAKEAEAAEAPNEEAETSVQQEDAPGPKLVMPGGSE